MLQIDVSVISATSSNTNENSGMGRDLSGCTVQSVTAPLQMDSLAQVHFFKQVHQQIDLC